MFEIKIVISFENHAVPVIDAVKSTITDYRNAIKFDEIMKKTEEQISLATFSATEQPAARRNRRLSTRLDNFVIEESIGQRNENDEIQSCFDKIIDISLQEFDKRFLENNEILIALSKAPNMEMADLKPLEKLGIKLPDEHEMKTVKKFVETKRLEFEEAQEKEESNDKKKKFDILDTLYEFREVFTDTYNLFAAVETFACSTSICESSFSALAQVNVPSRLSMTNKRMRNLAFLAFERDRLKNVSSDDVLKTFNDAKDRRVQLY